jgi:hypothetical protein
LENDSGWCLSCIHTLVKIVAISCHLDCYLSCVYTVENSSYLISVRSPLKMRLQ